MTEQRLSFMEFDSPWFFNPGTVRLPSPPDDLSTDQVRERVITGQLAQPYILETWSHSGLYFTPSNLSRSLNACNPA